MESLVKRIWEAEEGESWSRYVPLWHFTSLFGGGIGWKIRIEMRKKVGQATDFKPTVYDPPPRKERGKENGTE